MIVVEVDLSRERHDDVEARFAPCLCGCARFAVPQETLRLATCLYLFGGRPFGARWVRVGCGLQ